MTPRRPPIPMPRDFDTDEDYQEAWAEYTRRLDEYEWWQDYEMDRRKDEEAERRAEEARNE